MSGMMPTIDTLSYGAQEYHSPPSTGKLSSREQDLLAVIVIGPYVLAAGAVVPGTTYFSLAKKGRWVVNQLMRPRVVMSINAAVERNELAALIRGEPQTISIRPHFVVFRSWRWTMWSGFKGIPMLFPWVDVHPKDKKSSKSSPVARRGNAVGPGGGTKKKNSQKKKPYSSSSTSTAKYVKCNAPGRRQFGGKCIRRKGHSGPHFYK